MSHWLSDVLDYGAVEFVRHVLQAVHHRPGLFRFPLTDCHQRRAVLITDGSVMAPNTTPAITAATVGREGWLCRIGH